MNLDLNNNDFILGVLAAGTWLTKRPSTAAKGLLLAASAGSSLKSSRTMEPANERWAMSPMARTKERRGPATYSESLPARGITTSRQRQLLKSNR